MFLKKESSACILMDNIFWGLSETVARYDQEQFRRFLSLPPDQIERACCDEKGRLKHIIRAEHFDREFLEKICQTANAARVIAKKEDNFLNGLLRSKSILNYFSQPSSRTFLSFSMAEAHLGMRREEVRDVKTSSSVKGETEQDGLRTNSSYFDAIVCRHPSDIYDLFAVWVMKNCDREVPIINAGSGKMEHPTQGLLDYYTLWESFKGKLNDLTVLYVGDCRRGRTVHSLAKILSLHANQTALFVAPDELQIDSETEHYVTGRGTVVGKITDKPLRELVPLADVVYMTRIQNEHGGEGNYNPDFIFTEDMLDSMKPGAILMHPLPKREEIDPAVNYRHKDPRIAYWRQMRNGMWTRVALLANVFGVDDRIMEHYAGSISDAKGPI